MNKPVFLYAVLILFAAGALGADLGWEGSAVVGRRGSFPSEGYYGASNSFPRNSVVTVTNLETGRSVDVIIATRVSEPGVFLSLSDDAGDQLGMDPLVPARVRVIPVETRAQTPVLAPPVALMEQPFHADPDINPAAALADPDAMEVFPDVPPAPLAVDGPQPPAPPAVTPPGNGRTGLAQGVFRTAGVIPAPDPSEPDAVGELMPRPTVDARDPAVAAAEPGFPPDPRLDAQPFFTTETKPTNRMEEAVASIRGRTPPKELFPPPREDAVFTFLDVPRGLTFARPVDRRLAEASTPDTDGVRIAERPAAESLGKLEQPARPLMVELPTAESPAVADPVTTDEPAPEPAPPSERNGLVLRLDPAEPRPPAPEPEAPVGPPAAPPVSTPPPPPPLAERVTVDEWALASLPLTGALESSSFYLQVGAFASPRSARNVIDGFDSGYPFTVTALEMDSRTVFRVFVGPLSQDETGLMLRELRSRGYRDAFVRHGGA